MPTRHILLAAFFALTASVAAAFIHSVGDEAPDFRAKAVDGSVVTSDSPDAPTMLIVFACDSERCGEMAQAVEEFVWQPLKERGLRVIGIARDATEAEAKAMVAEKGLSFPVVADPNREIASLFSDRGVGIPRTVIVGEDGKILFQHPGYSQGREAELLMVAQKILEGEFEPELAAEPGTGPAVAASRLGAEDIRGKQAPELLVEAWATPEPTEIEGKYILTEFWATWCGPCIYAMPELQKMHDRYGDKLVIKSISNESIKTVERFVEKKGFTYPIGTDTQNRTAGALEVRGIPHGYLSDPDGKVIWQGHPMELKQGNKIEELIGWKK